MRRSLLLLFAALVALVPDLAHATPTWWLGGGNGGGGISVPVCAAGQYVRRNLADTGFDCAAALGGGDALKADPLSQFAATTSAQLISKITNATGTAGSLVFSVAPTFTGIVTLPHLLVQDVAPGDAQVNLSGSAPFISINDTDGALNAATAGVFRMETDQDICWKNAAGDGNVCLNIDGTDTLLFDGSPIGGTSDLSTLADATDLCDANQAVVRNAGDNGFACVAFPAGTGTVTGITGDTGAATDAAVPKIVGGTGIVTVSEAATDTITVGLSETVDLTTSSNPCVAIQNAINPWILDPATALTLNVVGQNTIDPADLHDVGDHRVCFEVIPSANITGNYPDITAANISAAGTAPLTINWKGQLVYDATAQAEASVMAQFGSGYDVGFGTTGDSNANYAGGGIGAPIIVNGLSFRFSTDLDTAWTVTLPPGIPFSTMGSATQTVGVFVSGTVALTFNDLQLFGKSGDINDMGVLMDNQYGTSINNPNIIDMAVGLQIMSGSGNTSVVGGKIEGSGTRYGTILGAVRNATAGEGVVSATCLKGAGFCTGTRYGLGPNLVHYDKMIMEGGVYGNMIISSCSNCSILNTYYEPGNIPFHNEIYGAGQCAAGAGIGAGIIENGGPCAMDSDCKGGGANGTCNSTTSNSNTIQSLVLSGSLSGGSNTSYSVRALGPGARGLYTTEDRPNIRFLGGVVEANNTSSISANYWPLFDWSTAIADKPVIDLRNVTLGSWTPGSGDVFAYMTTTANKAGAAYPGTILWPVNPESGTAIQYVTKSGVVSNSPIEVTALPTGLVVGSMIVVTDDSAAGACDSSAGTAKTLCRLNSTGPDVWGAVGDGGGGGVTATDNTQTWGDGAAATVAHTFNVSGTDDVVTYGNGTTGFNGAVTATSFGSGASATPSVLFQDSDGATGEAQILLDGSAAGPDSLLDLKVDVAGTLTSFVQLDGVTETVDMLKPLATPTLTTPVINGASTGTGVTNAATASTIVFRDTTGATAVNNLVMGYATQPTANETDTLTVSSANTQYFTGSTSGNIVKLPVTSTLSLGWRYVIANRSTVPITIQSSGANTINALGPGSSATYMVIDTGVTTAAGWDVRGVFASGTVALNTASVNSGACETDVTATATGLTTTDIISWTPNGDISAVSGYDHTTAGSMMIYPFPTADTIHFLVCNPTSSTIATPGAVTLNYRVIR